MKKPTAPMPPKPTIRTGVRAGDSGIWIPRNHTQTKTRIRTGTKAGTGIWTPRNHTQKRSHTPRRGGAWQTFKRPWRASSEQIQGAAR